MNIIFGDPIESIPDSFTVLPLDSFRVKDSTTPVIAWAVIEKIPLAELATAADNTKIHNELLDFYRQKQWNYCEHAIDYLMGKWNGELDTFYTDLLQRVIAFKQTPPAEDWDGLRVKV
jgi:adenylate cyclase